MERIPEDKILQYNPDTMVAIRQLYNLDKLGEMDEAIDVLDAWVKKQSHFVRKDYPREYLERAIISLKGSVERAKSQLESICTLRTLLPNYFEKYNAKNDFKSIQGYMYTSPLPKLTKDNIRIQMVRYPSEKQYTSQIFLQIYIYVVLIWEYLKAHDYNDGLIILVDFRNVNIMDYVTQINLTEMRQITAIFLDGFKSRVKSFLFISSSKTIDVLITIFKQMVSEKLKNRMHVLKTVEELHEHISKELLPSDYGGDEKPLDILNNEFLEVLGSEENMKYFKEMSKCRVDESLRVSSKSNDEFLGIAGTFRTLNVD